MILAKTLIKHEIIRLISQLVTIFFIVSFLSGCGTAFIASKQDDIVTQIDVWSAENEYGKAFTTLDYVKSTHPQYKKLQHRKKSLLIQATEYEQNIDKQIKQYIKNNQWAQALDLMDQAKEKYPLAATDTNNRNLAKTEQYLIEQQQKLLGSIEQELTLQRSQWMIQARPVYQTKLNADPRNAALKRQLDALNKEAKILSQKLTVLSQQAITKKHFKTARLRINQAIALDPSAKRQEILSQLNKNSKKSYRKKKNRKKQSQDKAREIQHNSLLQEIETSYNAGNLIETKQLISKLDENELNDIKIIQLRQELERSINYAIEQLSSEANKNYTDGQFHQAIKRWEQVLMYDPENVMAKKNILRAEKVIDKLTRLREKQNN